MLLLTPKRRSPRIRVMLGGHLLIAMTIVLGLVAAHSGQNVLGVVVALLLAFQAVSGFRSSAVLRRVSVSASLPRAAEVGGEAFVEIVLTNGKRRLAAKSIEIEAVIEAAGAPARLASSRALVAHVGPGGVARVRLPLRGLARGVARVVELRLSSAYPCDLFRRTLRFPLDEGEMTVRPARRTAAPPLRERTGVLTGARRAAVRGGGDVRGLRPYRVGDELRSIHWRASARTGTLVARDEDAHAASAWAVVLDVEPPPASGGAARDAGSPAGDSVEDCVSSAAALLRAAVEARVPAVLCASGLEEAMPVRTARGLDAALDALARWQPSERPAPAAPVGARTFALGARACAPGAASGVTSTERAPFPWISPASGAAPRDPDPIPPSIEDAARVDASVWALLAGVATGAAVGSPLDAAPQVVAAAVVLAIGRRAESFAPAAIARVALLCACVAFAALPGGAGPVVLVRFFAALVASLLLRRRTPGEHGFLLAMFAAETAVAAALSTHALAAPAALLSAVLAHRAVGSWHRLRAASRVARVHGPIVSPSAGPSHRRAADCAALACAVLAAPIFVALPRIDEPLLALPSMTPIAEPGVGDEVRLGRIGSVADGEEVVVRAKAVNAAARAAEPYFRVATYERFQNGSRWTSRLEEPSVQDYNADHRQFRMPRRIEDEDSPRWQFVADASASARLPLPELAASVAFRDPYPDELRRDDAGCLRPARRQGVARWSYEAAAGRAIGRSDDPTAEHLAELPAALAARLEPAVRDVVAGIDGDAEKAAALTSWVRGRARYAAPSDVGPLDAKDPVGDFLFRAREGHCELFAAALAASLRVAGIPSRVVGGYHASRWNELGGLWILRRRDAHAWVEAWLGGRWVRLDATPASALVADPYSGALGALARIRDALVFAWNCRVVGFGAETQRDVLAAARAALERALASVAPSAGSGTTWAAGVGVAAGLFWVGRRGRRRRISKRESCMTQHGNLVSIHPVLFYRLTLDSLAARGVRRAPHETPSEIAKRADGVLEVREKRALLAITSAFESIRYGGSAAPSAASVAEWLAEFAAPVATKLLAPPEPEGGQGTRRRLPLPLRLLNPPRN